MERENLIAKCLNLAEGRETPESWRTWWDSHETELVELLSRADFLDLRPCRHEFAWVPVLTSQKGAVRLLREWGVPFKASRVYRNQYWAELDAYVKGRERMRREKQKQLKARFPDLFADYPKFSRAMAQTLEENDEVKPGAAPEEIGQAEMALDFMLPPGVRQFFEHTSAVSLSGGIVIRLTELFALTLGGIRYCVLGEYWKEADGDLLLLRPGEPAVWYYAHEQDKVIRLCRDMTELLERELARYLKRQEA